MTTSADSAPFWARLDHLRSNVMHDPEQADAPVRAELIRTDDAGRRTVLLTLLAETYQQQGRARDAATAVIDAAAASKPLPGGDLRRTIVLGVCADLAVWDGHAAAMRMCSRYASAAVHGAQPELRRVALAGSLRAVALYHRASCEEGRRILTALLQKLPDHDPLAVMARAGLAAMHDGCRPYCQPAPVNAVPAMPGGVLLLGVDLPPSDYLAARVRRFPAAHSCDFAAARHA